MKNFIRTDGLRLLLPVTLNFSYMGLSQWQFLREEINYQPLYTSLLFSSVFWGSQFPRRDALRLLSSLYFCLPWSLSSQNENKNSMPFEGKRCGCPKNFSMKARSHFEYDYLAPWNRYRSQKHSQGSLTCWLKTFELVMILEHLNWMILSDFKPDI